MLKHSISMGCPKVVNLHYPTSLLIITFGKYIIFSLDFFLKGQIIGLSILKRFHKLHKNKTTNCKALKIHT